MNIIFVSSVVKNGNFVFKNSELYSQSFGSIVWTQFKFIAARDLSAFLFLSIFLSLSFFGQCNYVFFRALAGMGKINSYIAISMLAYLKSRPDLPLRSAKIRFVGMSF